MTLVVAQKSNHKVIILSDTLLSKEDDENTYVHRFSPDSSTIKTIIINPQICISFAGKIEYAEKAIKAISNSDKSKNEILDILTGYNKISKDKTHFLVYFGDPIYELYVIKDNNAPLSVEKCYLGLQSAYKLYKNNFENEQEFNNNYANQSNFKMQRIPDTFSADELKTYSRMWDSLLGVIESDIKEIGGFITSLIYEENNMKYLPYLTSNKSVKELEKAPTIIDGKFSYDFGKVEKGDHVESFIYNNTDFIAVHFPLAKIGYIYERKDFGLFTPEKINLDEIDFFDMLENTRGNQREYSVLINHTEQHFAIKADEYFKIGNYEKAILFYNRALERLIKINFIDGFSSDFHDISKHYEKIINKKQLDYVKEGFKIIFHMKGLSCYQLAINIQKAGIDSNKESYINNLTQAHDDFEVVIEIDPDYRDIYGNKTIGFLGSTVALLSFQ